MPTLLVRHRVADYAVWKPVFDEYGITRRANGALGGRIFRSADDPGEILILIEWDDIARAQLFVQSDDLREAMIRGGVTDRPDVWILKDAE